MTAAVPLIRLTGLH